MRFVFRQERRRQVAWALPTAQEQAAAAARSTASHSEPGVSVSPWAMIDTKTHSAARLKSRSPAGICVGEDEQRERHRRHALGAEPGHEPRPVGRRARADQREPTATGRATSSVDGDDRHRRPAVAEQAVERQQRAEDDEHAELDDLHDVVRALLERRAQVGAADAERDRADEDGDQPVALGRQRPRRRRWRTRRRARRATPGGRGCPSRGSSRLGDEARGDAGERSRA